MPEGDTVFKVAAYLARRLSGRRLKAGHAGSPPADLAHRRIEAVEALGKHLMIFLEDGRVVRSHLGMWGSWHWYPPGAPWRKRAHQARIVLDTGEAVYVCFNPKEVEILRATGVRRRELAASLGPDLLAGDPPLLTITARARELATDDTMIADVLLDQRVACGLGNVFKSEVLFVGRTAPAKRLAVMDDEQVARLYVAARRLLQRNIGGGPRVTRPGNEQAARLWVYGRRGQRCFRCGESVLYARMGQHNRSTYWCPACQV